MPGDGRRLRHLREGQHGPHPQQLRRDGLQMIIQIIVVVVVVVVVVLLLLLLIIIILVTLIMIMILILQILIIMLLLILVINGPHPQQLRRDGLQTK